MQVLRRVVLVRVAVELRRGVLRPWKDLEERHEEVIVEFAKQVVELDGPFWKAIHMNLNISKFMKQFAALSGGVATDDGRIFFGVLNGGFRQDSDQIEP